MSTPLSNPFAGLDGMLGRAAASSEAVAIPQIQLSPKPVGKGAFDCYVETKSWKENPFEERIKDPEAREHLMRDAYKFRGTSRSEGCEISLRQLRSKYYQTARKKGAK